MTKIELMPEDDDDPAFITLVQQTISGSIISSSLNHFAIFKLNNWFNDKWTGFGGVHRDYSGLLSFPAGIPATYRTSSALPPFARSRTVYLKTYGEPSIKNPAGVYYFSGNSTTNGRASLLASIPGSGKRWNWYVGYTGTPEWHAIRHKNVSPIEIEAWNSSDC